MALIWTPSVWSEQNGKNTVNSVSLLIPIFGTKVKSKGRGKERAKGKVSRLLTNENVRFVHSTANQKILCLLVFLISHGGIVHTTINPIFTSFQVFWRIKFDDLTCLVSTCVPNEICTFYTRTYIWKINVLTLSFLQYKNFIIIINCVYSMSNSQDGTIFKFTSDRCLDQLICFWINWSCGFIQNKNFTFSEKSACKTYKLSFRD